jgi:trimethylamine--corrinoid protein Co-methyltransferase
MIGGTGTVTIAGSLVQANAEALSGLLITQLIREGAPVIGAGGILYMDMARGLISYAAPEFMLAMTAFSEMYQYYKLPIFSFAGCSDSKTFDQQAAAEGSLWMLITALGGGNLIHDVGYIESGITASYEMLVGMNEVAGLVKRFMRGIEVSAETIALDVISQVGPGGQFLDHPHTYQHFRGNWAPKLFDRAAREDWELEGRLTMADKANAKVRNILETHKPKPVSTDVTERLDAIIQKAEKRAK